MSQPQNDPSRLVAEVAVTQLVEWLPKGNKAAVDRLDGELSVTSGSMMVATEKEDSRKSWS